ncbi:MAG: FkbM family methyltransferase [Dehalococcoidia bacterium]
MEFSRLKTRLVHPRRSWHRWRHSSGRPAIATIRSGPAAGLRIRSEFASADYGHEENELPVQEAIASLLKPGDVFYDVGANVGFFSLLAARQVGQAGRVFAFEPLPEIGASLVKNAGLNGFDTIQLLPYAVADRDGRANLQTTSHPGGATLEGFGTPGDRTGTVSVGVRTLDGLLGSGIISKPNVIKIDVEGAEAAVLRGAARIISEHPVLVYELDAATAEELDAKRAEVEEELRRAGYSISELDRSYGALDLVRHFLATHPLTDRPR